MRHHSSHDSDRALIKRAGEHRLINGIEDIACTGVVALRVRATLQLFARWAVGDDDPDPAAACLPAYLDAVSSPHGTTLVACVDCRAVGPFSRGDALPECGGCA